jgi:hypothetical protein
MLKSFFISAALCFVFLQVNAQSLYVPRDVKKAYKNQTRSMDGKPGRKYWQNTAHYNIAITVMPPNQTVKGREQITYINNSPDTLKSLNMKLILNVHRAGATRFRPTDPDYITDGMQVDSISVNGTPKKWDNKQAKATNQELGLSAPLLPHDSVKLNVTWHYELATGTGREGVIDLPSISPTFIPAFLFMTTTTAGISWSLMTARSFIMILMTTSLALLCQKTLLFGQPEPCRTPHRFCSPNT